MFKSALTLLLSTAFCFGFSDISNDELVELSRQNAVVVDVRTVEEWAQSGIIGGSSTVTYFDNSFRAMKEPFMAKIRQLTGGDKTKEIVVVCRTGQRSKLVSGVLEREGFKKVYNLKDGVMGWAGERRALARYDTVKTASYR